MIVSYELPVGGGFVAKGAFELETAMSQRDLNALGVQLHQAMMLGRKHELARLLADAKADWAICLWRTKTANC